MWNLKEKQNNLIDPENTLAVRLQEAMGIKMSTLFLLLSFVFIVVVLNKLNIFF